MSSASATTGLLGRYWRRFHQIPLLDFSGGLNVRDAATELAPNESPDLWNVALDERGGVVKRLGFDKHNATPAANLITYAYASSTANLLFWYSQADGKLYTDPGSGVLTLVRTWTAGHPLGIVDFAGKIYANHIIDGLYQSTTGAVWTLVSFNSGSAPNGSLMTVWQNKLWIADPSSNLLTFSAPGDATKWDSADDAGSNHIQEGNEFPIVALYGGAGTDFQTLPTLIIGKRSGGGGSLHRVTDAATGDYVTLDQQIGPAGSQAITSLYGTIYLVSTSGVFATNGQTPLVPVGQKIARLFEPANLNYSLASGFSVGVQGNRVEISIASNGATANDTCLKYYPLYGSFTQGSDAMACYVNYRSSGDQLLGGSPTAAGKIYRMNVGGNDDGVDITSWFLTRVFEPIGGLEGRLQRVRVKGRAPALKAQVLVDFATTGTQNTLTIAQGAGFVWGTGIWGVDSWGAGALPEDYAEWWPRVHGRAFQLRFDEESSLSSSALEGSAAIGTPIGGWALYGADLMVSLIGFT